MTQIPYIELDRAECLKLLPMIADGEKYNPDKVRIMAQNLAFAPGWDQLSFEDYTVLPYRHDKYLRHENSIKPLHYTATPYEDNDLGAMDFNLNEETLPDYIKFYTGLYISDGSRLKVLNHADDMDWIEDPAPVTRQSLEKELRDYPKIIHHDDGFITMALCHFRTAIMEVTFDVAFSGFVEIKDFRVLIDDLPVKAFS